MSLGITRNFIVKAKWYKVKLAESLKKALIDEGYAVYDIVDGCENYTLVINTGVEIKMYYVAKIFNDIRSLGTAEWHEVGYQNIKEFHS